MENIEWSLKHKQPLQIKRKKECDHTLSKISTGEEEEDDLLFLTVR